MTGSATSASKIEPGNCICPIRSRRPLRNLNYNLKPWNTLTKLLNCMLQVMAANSRFLNRMASLSDTDPLNLTLLFSVSRRNSTCSRPMFAVFSFQCRNVLFRHQCLATGPEFSWWFGRLHACPSLFPPLKNYLSARVLELVQQAQLVSDLRGATQALSRQRRFPFILSVTLTGGAGAVAPMSTPICFANISFFFVITSLVIIISLPAIRHRRSFIAQLLIIPALMCFSLSVLRVRMHAVSICCVLRLLMV